MSDPIASLRALHEEATPEDGRNASFMARARLVHAMHANLPALLDAAELLRTIRGVAFATEIDAVLSRLHVEDTP